MHYKRVERDGSGAAMAHCGVVSQKECILANWVAHRYFQRFENFNALKIIESIFQVFSSIYMYLILAIGGETEI